MDMEVQDMALAILPQATEDMEQATEVEFLE